MKTFAVMMLAYSTLAITLAAEEHAQSGSNPQVSRATQPLSAIPANLDGREFCRTVRRDGLFGQPAGEARHCVWFRNGLITDNANTFFGNPPETLPYVIKNGEKNRAIILVRRNGTWEPAYTLQGTALVNNAGAILTEVIKLEGRTFCRKVQTGGFSVSPSANRNTASPSKTAK